LWLQDAAKQYLKLLVLTAASGGTVNGAAACRFVVIYYAFVNEFARQWESNEVQNGNNSQVYFQCCSARDLSMLLEALLKTPKLSLLKDIMNKNGMGSNSRSVSSCNSTL